jgi:hypothetical protein
LHQHADFVLKAIYDLIDEADKARYPVRVEHTLSYLGVDETAEQSELNHLEGGDDLARMLMSDVILETFSLNLKMPVTAFYPSEKPVVRADFLTALHSILELLKQNPGFLSYRYGSEVADRQVAAIQALIGLLGTNQPLKLSLTSVATFKDGHQETTKRIYQISLD